MAYDFKKLGSNSAGSWLSDMFLGTKNNELYNQSQLMNEANRFSEYMADKANDFTAQQNANAMAFAEKMSNTSYQRAKADMLSAGINPLVAYSNGASGASTPSGSSGSGAMATGAKGSVSGFNGGILGKTTAKFVNTLADHLSGKTAVELAKAII